MAPEQALKLPAESRFDCRSSGRCCRAEWGISVRPSKLQQLAEAGLMLPVVQSDGGATYLGRGNRGCPMLGADNSCEIHGELGKGAKPASCQVFPFIFTPMPDGVHVSLSYLCPTVQQNLGRPLRDRAGELRATTQLVEQETVLTGPFQLTPTETVGYSGYCLWEGRLLDELGNRPTDKTFISAVRGLEQHASKFGRVPLEDHFPSQAEEISPKWLHAETKSLLKAITVEREYAAKTEPKNLTDRYLTSLIQRKLLLKQPTVLHGLLLLLVVQNTVHRSPFQPSATVAALELLLTHGPGYKVSEFPW